MALQTERRVPLNRDRVLHAAIRLADEGGIESLSMRKLGQALGVEAMSLYNHVANKDDILNGIVDLVVTEIELPSADEDWETALRDTAISTYDAFLRHPWVCNLMLSVASLGPARLRYIDALLRRIREAGFSPEATYHAYHALDSHIVGFTLWQLGHSIRKEDAAALEEICRRRVSLDDYPDLAEHARQHYTPGPHKDEGEFEFGLRLVLDGLRRIRG